MNFNQRLMLAFVAPAVLFIVSLTCSIWALKKTQTQFDHYIQTEQAIAAGVQEMYAQGLQMGQALRNIVLDPSNPQAPKNLDAARTAFDSAYSNTLNIAEGTPAKEALAPLADMRAAQAKAQDKVLALIKTNPTEAAAMLNAEETPAWRKLRGALLDQLKASRELSKQTHAALNVQADRARMVAFSVALLALVAAVALGLMVARILRREIGGDPSAVRQAVQRISKGDLTGTMPDSTHAQSLVGTLATMQDAIRALVGQVHSSSHGIELASNEIAQGNQDLSARTEQTASNLQETAAGMEQIAGAIGQTADSARRANQLAADAATVAVRGGSVVSQVVSTMDAINASARKINDIIGVVDSIAFQTNILALNAAVEAARAGDQGRGFAVVASEVRTLAQRSAAAAKEIKTLIGTSVEHADAGSKLVADAGQTMNEIVSSVQRVNDIISEITVAAGEQHNGIGQMNAAVNNLDQMTQQNAAMVEQSTAAAQSLLDQAQSLVQAVSLFKITPGTARTVVSGR